MKIEDIRALAEIMAKNSLSTIHVVEGELDLRMERQAAAQAVPAAPAAAAPAEVPAVPEAQAGEPVDFTNLKEIKSPMVGTFYEAPSPDAEPFVKIGSKVKKGDVLCVIEAMKLLNEITSDVDGEIVDVCAGNGQVVEYGQVLYKIF